MTLAVPGPRDSWHPRNALSSDPVVLADCPTSQLPNHDRSILGATSRFSGPSRKGSPIGAPMAGPRSMPRRRMGGQRPCRATTCRRRWRGWPGCLRSSPSQRRSRGSRTVGRTARSQEGFRDPVTWDPGRGPGPRQRRGRRKSPRPGGRRGVRERHDLTTDTGGCPTGP